MENEHLTSLNNLAAQTLGESAGLAGPVRASCNQANDGWRVEWTNALGVMVRAECPVGGNSWSQPQPVSVDAQGKHEAATRAPDVSANIASGLLTSLALQTGRAGLRSGRRVVGVPPRFPSASLVLCREEAGGWRDLGFADEAPEQDIGSVALAVAPDFWLAAYLVVGPDGRSVCRVVQLALRSSRPPSTPWRKLPPYPQAPGMAGMMVGAHQGVLIAAGGANFPDVHPWDGGKKSIYPEIHVLLPGENAWRAAGHLPGRRGYGATVSLPDGVLIAGGEDGDQVFQDSLLLRWNGTKVEIIAGPPLPAPTTCAVATVLNGSVYLSGGYCAGAPRVSQNFFWRLDWTAAARKWEVLPSWPGPTRALAATAAVGGAVYVISGIEIGAADGKETPGVYLKDAYRYRPGAAWEKLPDPPWTVLAAASPAPVTENPARVFMLGGVDGRQAGKLPRVCPLPDDIIYLDVARNEWRHWPERWPTPVVCVPAVQVGAEWIISSGELMAGVRTTDVWAWKIED